MVKGCAKAEDYQIDPSRHSIDCGFLPFDRCNASSRNRWRVPTILTVLGLARSI
jgi:hypothetical protein